MQFPTTAALHICSIAAGIVWYILLSRRVGYLADKQDPGVLVLFVAVVHAIYGAIWGGIYSQAVYAHKHSYDPKVWRQALLGVIGVAIIHGLYLMHEGNYRTAAYHLRTSIPRLRDARRARFSSSICDLHYLPEARALRSLRSTWSALSDEQREAYSRQLKKILAEDAETLNLFLYWAERNFRKEFIPRRGKGA